GRGHLLPGGEADTLAQLERVPLAAVRRLVARREPGPDAPAIRSGGDERLVDLLHEPDGLVLEDVRLVERLRVFLPRDRDRAASLRLRGRVSGSGGGSEGCGGGESAGAGGHEQERGQSTSMHGSSFASKRRR